MIMAGFIYTQYDINILQWRAIVLMHCFLKSAYWSYKVLAYMMTPRLHKSHLLSYGVASPVKPMTISGAIYSADPTYK